MNKINVGRVLLGGLVAGLVLNVGEFLLNGVVLAKQMEEDFRRLNVPLPGGSFMVTAVVMTFILGIVIVLMYAMIRPRFGAGVKTAIIAGLTAWFFACVYTGVIYGVLGFTSFNLVLIGIVWGLFEYAIGAVAGAWLYKEAEG